MSAILNILIIFHRIKLVVKQMGCSPYEGVRIIPFGTCNGIYQHCPGMYCAALVAKKENECNFRCTCSRPCLDVVIPVGPLPRSSNESMICEVIVTQVWRIYSLGQKLSPILNFKFNYQAKLWTIFMSSFSEIIAIRYFFITSKWGKQMSTSLFD